MELVGSKKARDEGSLLHNKIRIQSNNLCCFEGASDVTVLAQKMLIVSLVQRGDGRACVPLESQFGS